MSYFAISMLRQDVAFLNRTAACYATETPQGTGDAPDVWATKHDWDMAAQPGFGDAYAYAIANGNENPGADPAVITDAQILSAVQALMGGE